VIRKALLLAVLASVPALIVSGAAYSRSQARPTTIVVANGPIAAFAQDGGQIAWASIASHATCPWQVRIRLLATGRQKLINPATGRTCGSDTGFDPSHTTYLALAGRSALWTLLDQGNDTYQQLVTASYTSSSDVQLEELVYSNGWGDGAHLGGIAGDFSTLVYGVVNASISGPPDCEDTGTCTTVVTGGGIERVSGSGTVTVPGAPPPAMLAASGRRIALAVAESVSRSSGSVEPGSPGTVDVIDGVSGSSIGSFAPFGDPLAIALSPSAVGVLISIPAGTRIEFRTHAGVPIRRVVVPANATDLSMTRTKAVFRVGRAIYAVGVRRGAPSRVATAAATPIGLSIEGTRVAWAENVNVHGSRRGRIQKITVR
jgi:hypothetical protein